MRISGLPRSFAFPLYTFRNGGYCQTAARSLISSRTLCRFSKVCHGDLFSAFGDSSANSNVVDSVENVRAVIPVPTDITNPNGDVL